MASWRRFQEAVPLARKIGKDLVPIMGKGVSADLEGYDSVPTIGTRSVTHPSPWKSSGVRHRQPNGEICKATGNHGRKALIANIQIGIQLLNNARNIRWHLTACPVSCGQCRSAFGQIRRSPCLSPTEFAGKWNLSNGFERLHDQTDSLHLRGHVVMCRFDSLRAPCRSRTSVSR